MKFQAARVTHEYIQTNCAPPETVFPHLCPVREADWVPGWQYHLIYSQSGYAEAGCIFITKENDRETTWIVTDYNPAAYRIAFVWVDPGMVAARISIALHPDPTSQPKSAQEPAMPSAQAAKRRKNTAQGVSPGYNVANAQAPEGRKTSAHIQYTYTALSPDGNRQVARYDETWFREKMQGWEAAINHYLKTGKRIDPTT